MMIEIILFICVLICLAYLIVRQMKFEHRVNSKLKDCLDECFDTTKLINDVIPYYDSKMYALDKVFNDIDNSFNDIFYRIESVQNDIIKINQDMKDEKLQKMIEKAEKESLEFGE